MKIIDFHVHPLPVISESELIFEMNSAKVEKAVLLSMDLDPSILNSKILRKDIEKHFEYTSYYDIEPIYAGMDYVLNNAHTPMEHVAKIVRSQKDKCVGFGSLHIGYKSKRYVKTKLKEVKYYKEEFGFRGIKILPTLQFFNPASTNLKAVFKFAEKEDLIILYHTGCDPGPWELPLLSTNANPQLIESLVRKFNVKVVLAHMGSYSSMIPGIWFDEALKLMSENKHVYGDLSAVPYLVNQSDKVESLRKSKLLSKVLYGSDFPVTSIGATGGMSTIIDIVKDSSILNESEKEEIFYLNADELLD